MNSSKMLKIAAGAVLVLGLNAHAGENPAFELGTMIGKSIGQGVSALFSSSKEEKVEKKPEESSGGISGFFGSFFKEPTAEEVLAKASDKEMTKAFLEAKKTNSDLTFAQSKNGIKFDKVIVPFDAAHTFNQARSLCAQIDTSDDEIAKVYKKVVTGRGNYYSVYSGAVNSAILNAISGQIPTTNGSNEYYKIDFDNAIVEYTPQGTIVSALTRMETITLNMMIHTPSLEYYNIKISQESRVFSKEQLGVVSRIVSKRTFDDNLVQTSKQDIKPAQAVATSDDKSAKIKELFGLYQAGALTKEEFDKEKSKVLDGEKTQPTPQTDKSSTVEPKQSPLQAMILNSMNEKNGTHFTTMKEYQDYVMQKYNSQH